MLANLVERSLEEVGVVHAGDLNRVLEGEKQAVASALFGLHLEKIVPFIGHGACRYDVVFPAGQYARQCALP